ncbi:uncharacterized protein KGF55_000102 [Candida pseudojiufengensis]|uniref:uncharacterized protein n=1 Tax=Candida pseudojiufengensis TaxID=497109 RepID=UPI002224DBC0|nr:uncharacterized protein KGF55_000102 [Candida pseudojiufengensis]KAI5967424.1 hypothetical protein KGF55_000102 [Candida pseudojiufengensis]
MNLIQTPYDKDIVDIGKSVYRTLYENAIGSSEFRGITSRRRFNDHEEMVNFIREHKPATVNNFCRVFGRLLVTICLGKEFEMVNKTTHALELSLIEDIKEMSSTEQVSLVQDLIGNFIHNNGSLIVAVFPFFLMKDKTNYCSESECLKRINCLKNVCKYAMATTRENLMRYEQHLSRRSAEIPGFIFTHNLFTRLLDDMSKYASINVIAIDDNTCLVENTQIARSHLTEIYEKAKTSFTEAWENICLFSKTKTDMRVVYQIFARDQQFQTTSFLPDRLELIFDAENIKIDDKGSVLKWIEKATLALMVVIYISSMNSFRVPELNTLNFRARNFAKRNLLFISGKLFIQTLYNKNKQEDPRLRCYSTEVTIMMVAFIYALKPLQFTLVEQDLTTFTSSDFRGEVSGTACFQTFCFVDNSGRLITASKFSRFLQSLITYKKIGIMILRQAISYFAKRNFPRLMNHAAAEFMENLQGHTMETGERSYGQDINSIGIYFSTYKFDATIELFEKWCEYLQISGKSSLTKTTESKNQVNFGLFDMNQINSAILGQFPDFDFSSFQYHAILQIALGKSKSLLIAATGAGKTFCASLPMQLFKRLTNRRFLHVLAVPTLKLKDEMLLSLEEDFSVLDGDDFGEIVESTDIVVCCFDLLKSKEFEDCLIIHRERLGFIVLDEANLIESAPVFRRFYKIKASIVDLFQKQILLSATRRPTTKDYLERQFKIKLHEINGITDEGDGDVTMNL